jgi:hypothetical protein
LTKLLTVIAVLASYCWGTAAWFTSAALLANSTELLANLTNVIYLSALLAPAIRARLTVSTTQLLVALSLLSALAFVGMMNESWIPPAYVAVGIFRLFLQPLLISFCIPNLGPVASVVLLSAGYYAANAVFKPIIADLVAQGLWRGGLAVGIVCIFVSAWTAYQARPRKSVSIRWQLLWLMQLEQSELAWLLNYGKRPNPFSGIVSHPRVAASGQRLARLMRSQSEGTTPSIRLLGKSTLIIVGINVLYGLREIAVFPLAERLFSEKPNPAARLEAGKLEGIAESAMFLGVFLVPLLHPRFITLALTFQVLSSLLIIAALQLHNLSVLYAALWIGGISFAVLERIGEVTYFRRLDSLPNSGVAYQWIDTLYRLASLPGRYLANLPVLEHVYAGAALLSLLTLVLTKTWVANWVGGWIQGVAEGTQRETRNRIISIILIVRVRLGRSDITAPNIVRTEPELVMNKWRDQLRSSGLR